MEKPTSKPQDVVLVHGVTADTKGLKVLRARMQPGSSAPVVEQGELRPLEDGKPLRGDVVRLQPRAETPWVCDVETQVSVPALAAETRERTDVSSPQRPMHAGPARVATAAYRSNWDAIWPQKRAPSGLN